MRLIGYTMIWVLVTTPAIHAQQSLSFQAQVNRGEVFRKEIGLGLVFILRPKDNGWDITVQAARGAVSRECDDFVWMVTPPYRSSNPRYLDTSYGIKAQEAIKWSPREFAFVLQAADCKKEADRVSRVLWPYSYSEQEVKEAEEKLGTSRLGKGSLTILDSKISPAPEDDNGQIDWLKFEVRISFPRNR